MTPSSIPRYSARAGPRTLGTFLPGVIGLLAATSLGGALIGLGGERRIGGVGPSMYLLFISIVATWLLWKVLRTVWATTVDSDGGLICQATSAKWSLARDDVVAVKGDAYGLFLVLVTRERKIWLWAWLDDRSGLVGAIRRANPAAEFDQYVAERG
jgi:hypothetical protein